MAINKDILAALSVRLTTDASQFNKGISGATSKMVSMKAMAGKLAAGLGAMFSIQMATRFFRASIEGYDQQAKAEAGLLTALKGRQDIQENLMDQASALQKKTLFGDEETIAGASRLAQVLGENENALKRLLPLVQDFATAKGMKMEMAAELIAKTVGSSTNALSRYGITIEGTVGSAERLESAVKALNDMVGGQAVAAAAAGIGAFTQLKNAWGDYMEEVGRSMVEGDNANSFMGWLKAQIEEGAEVKKMVNELRKASKETGLAITFMDISMLKQNQTLSQNAMFVMEAYEAKKKLAELAKKDSKEPPPEVVIVPWLEKLNIKLKEELETKKNILPYEWARMAVANERIKKLQEEIKFINELTNKDLKRDKIDKISPILQGIQTPTEDLGYGYLRLAQEQWLKTSNENNEKFVEGLQRTKNSIAEFNAFATESFNFMAYSLAESFGEMLATGDKMDWSKALLNPLADILMRLGEMLIATGIGIAAFKTSLESLQAPVALVAGAMLIALAAGIKAGIKNLGNSGGGSVTLPTSTQSDVDPTNRINRNYGERLRIDINLYGSLEGNTIRLASDRTAIEQRIIT